MFHHFHDRLRGARHQVREAWHAGRHGFGRHGFGGHGLGGRHGHDEAGERRGRRVFDGGELRLLLLKLIEPQPRHGYDLIREIEQRSGGAYAPSPGMVYPTLTLLAEMGHAEEQVGEAARRVLAITDAGRAYLAERAAEVAALLARLAAMAEVRERTDAGPVRRAMHNLHAALHDRLAQPNADRALILAVAALLDEAAGKIERL